MTRTVDVVFVVDGSKTMLAYFSDARNSLFRAIGELPPDTSFACIYAGAESRRQFGPLIRSTEAAREAYAFVNDLQPDMTAFADVGQAIRAANSLNAKTIWIVTNGGLAQSDKTARDALSAAAEGTGQVNTVLHFALHPDWRKFLFKLAQRGNGACVAEDGISVLRQPEGPGTFVDPSLSKSSFYQVRQ